MPEHELWLTALFNKYLAGAGNAAMALVGFHTEDPAKPWSNAVTLEIAGAVVVMLLFAWLRPRLSVDRPGATQHGFEVIYGFLREQSKEIVGHEGPKHLHVFASIFFFVLFMSLLGVFPGFESPTMFPEVPLGCALITFGYYHVAGVRTVGLGKYLMHFVGPVWWLFFLMIPIEILSHLGRMLSLTVRLFANLFASESVALVFLGLVPVGIPMIFLGEHIFKAFVQAYIFALLTMVYVAGGVAQEH